MVNSDELPGKAVKPASRAPRKDVSLGLVSKTFGIMFLMEFTMFYVIVLHVVNDISAQNLHVPHSVSNASFQSLEIACKTIQRLSMLQNYDEGPSGAQSHFGGLQASRRSSIQNDLWETECKNLCRNHKGVYLDSRSQNKIYLFLQSIVFRV